MTWWLLPTVKHALLALHVEWCGEGGTHFLVELALRSSVLRDRDAAGVWGYHAGHISRKSSVFIAYLQHRQNQLTP